MNPLPPPPLTAVTTDVVGSQRVSFEEDSLFLEAQDILGTYQPLDEIFWEEVEEVYLWRSTDWSSIGVGFFLVAAAALLARAVLAILGLDALLANALVAGAALLLCGLVTYAAVRISPRRNIRVVGGEREIRFHTSDRGVVRTVLRRMGLDAEGF